MDSAILLFEEELVTEDVSERLPVYAMYVCLTEKRDLCNMLLLGAVNDVVTLASSVMEFAPGVWWNLQLDSGNGFGVVYTVSAFASADSDARAFPPISFENVERSQYQDDWNASYYAEFNGLWKSNAFRRLIEEGLPKNANVVTGKWVKIWKTDDRGNVVKSKSRMAERGSGHIQNVFFPEMLVSIPTAASVNIAVAVRNKAPRY